MHLCMVGNRLPGTERRMAQEFFKRVDNPVEALVAVGKENTELHEELARVYGELDLYRNALTEITEIPGPAAAVALRALAQKRMAS